MADRWIEQQTLTRAAWSTTNETLGLSIANCKTGIRIIAMAESGANLVNLNGRVFLWEPSQGKWMRNLDLDVVRTGINLPELVIADLPLLIPDGRIFIESSGTTVSAGTTITWIVKVN